MENWQMNLSLIPGIALILTGANRMALGLTDEINARLLSNPEPYRQILPLKIVQLKRLSLAIILLYISLALLIINALLNAMEWLPAQYDMYLVFTSILIFLIAVFYKIQFSYNAYSIRQRQFEKFLKNTE